MITFKEINAISSSYFDIIEKRVDFVVLKSKNTNHFWVIRKYVSQKYTSIIVEHKHQASEQYHVQQRWHPRDVKGAVRLIKAHDEFQLRGRKNVNKEVL